MQIPHYRWAYLGSWIGMARLNAIFLLLNANMNYLIRAAPMKSEWKWSLKRLPEYTQVELKSSRNIPKFHIDLDNYLFPAISQQKQIWHRPKAVQDARQKLRSAYSSIITWARNKCFHFITGMKREALTCRYCFYSRADFWVFRPLRSDTLNRSRSCQISPWSAQGVWVYGPKP